MERKILLLIVVVTASSIAVSRSASFLSDGTDQIPGGLEVEPADGPNGKYAVIDEETGEIAVIVGDENPDMEAEGVNEDSITPIHRVFIINNTENQTVDVLLTDDADDVRFYLDDDPSHSLEGPDSSHELQPESEIAVGLLVDTRGQHDVEAADNFIIHTNSSGSESEVEDFSAPSPETESTDGTQGTPSPETETTNGTETPTPTPTPTPTETPTATVTVEETATDQEAASGEISTTTETRTPTPENGSSSAEEQNISGGLVPELGGLAPFALWVLIIMAPLLLVALLGIRRYRDSDEDGSSGPPD